MTPGGVLLGKYVLTFTDGHDFDFAVVGRAVSDGGATPRVAFEQHGLRVTREDGSWSFAPWTALTAVDWFPAGTEGV